ncbi:hypothetical protein ATANTOWER_011970 [Ataeniobius toweri]|uniref:Uncharacterized protein n=1 Tax=Ataeniobius toweri TaxID=208326 RepID=A0ABU7ANP7_9TELE|nr:hypothetical protein [Ataeniobius toweri]
MFQLFFFKLEKQLRGTFWRSCGDQQHRWENLLKDLLNYLSQSFYKSGLYGSAANIKSLLTENRSNIYLYFATNHVWDTAKTYSTDQKFGHTFSFKEFSLFS